MRSPRSRALLATVALLLPGVAGAAEPSIPPGSQLTLEHAIEMARTYHPTHLAARAEAGAAEERVGAARSWELPQIEGNGEYLRATDNGIGSAAYLSVPGIPRAPSTGRNANSAETFDNELLGLSVYQHLFDFGRTRGLIDERTAEAEAAKARLQLVDLDLVFAVTERYFVLLAAQQRVKVFEKAVTQRQEHLHEAEVKSRAGLQPEIDTYSAEAELARAKLHLVDARNAVATGRAALDEAIGLGPDAPDYRLAEALGYQEVEGSLDDYVRSALAQRADLAALEDEARAAGARIEEHRSDYLPTLGATAGYSARGQGLPASNNFDVGIVLRWPIFDGFRTDHEVAEAKLEREALEHHIDAARHRIFLEVKRAFLDWQASLQRIHRAEQAVATSRSVLDLADERYETGLGNILELIDAQRRYTEDEAGYVDTLAGFSIARAALERASGGPPAERHLSE